MPIDITNREWSTLFWLIILAIWALRQEKIRKSIKRVFSIFLSRQILIPVFFMFTYAYFEIRFVSRIGLWSSTDIKETAYWLIGTALALLVSASDATKKPRFFRKIVKESIRFGIFVEFLVGLYSFSMPLEFVLVPLVVILAGVDAVAAIKPQDAQTKKVTGLLLGALGLGLFGHSLVLVFREIDKLAYWESLRGI